MPEKPLHVDEELEREVRRLVDEYGLTEEQARTLATEPVRWDVAYGFDGSPLPLTPPPRP